MKLVCKLHIYIFLERVLFFSILFFPYKHGTKYIDSKIVPGLGKVYPIKAIASHIERKNCER